MELVRKDRLLAAIRADRARFDDALNSVPPDRFTDPILPGGWSVKDVVAHIAWGDSEAIRVMEARALLGSDLWDLSEDERNAAVVRESRTRDAQVVLQDYRTAFETYLSKLAELSEEDLNEPSRFRGLSERIPGWAPWRVLYDPGHCDEHRRAIEGALPAARDTRSPMRAGQWG